MKPSGFLWGLLILIIFVIIFMALCWVLKFVFKSDGAIAASAIFIMLVFAGLIGVSVLAPVLPAAAKQY